MSLMPKLKGMLVDLDESGRVVQVRPGHNMSDFFQFVRDGMYGLEIRKKRDRKLDQSLLTSMRHTPLQPMETSPKTALLSLVSISMNKIVATQVMQVGTPERQLVLGSLGLGGT